MNRGKTQCLNSYNYKWKSGTNYYYGEEEEKNKMFSYEDNNDGKLNEKMSSFM